MSLSYKVYLIYLFVLLLQQLLPTLSDILEHQLDFSGINLHFKSKNNRKKKERERI